MPGYFWSRGGVAAGQCCRGKGVCFSAPFLQAQMLNKRKFFPLMFFDFLCLGEHIPVAGAGWHLPQLAPRPWAPGCLCFELLAGGVWSSHTGFCSPRLASNPQKLAWVPLVGGSQSGGDNGSSVGVPSAAVGYRSKLGPVQTPTSQVPWDWGC